jgi:membrane protein DedA with SNARE-associated domain
VTHLLLTYGLVLLFLAVAIESAGVPIPGETALITAAVFATPQQHRFSIVWVIVVAATAAILGDNVGYVLGRVGGRRLVERIPLLKKQLPRGERFFEKHGGKTVFIGRFIAFLRVTAAWLAGITEMHWLRFFAWNAAGGIVWATGVGLLAYYAGKTAADAVGRYGLYGAAAIVVLGALVLGGVYFARRRLEASA